MKEALELCVDHNERRSDVWKLLVGKELLSSQVDRQDFCGTDTDRAADDLTREALEVRHELIFTK